MHRLQKSLSKIVTKEDTASPATIYRVRMFQKHRKPHARQISVYRVYMYRCLFRAFFQILIVGRAL